MSKHGERSCSSRLSNRQRGVLVAAGVANALIFLDQTAVVVALPSIQREFHSSTAALEWTIGAYLLALATFVACSGRLADLYGRRRLFIAGVALFAVGSALCAAAPSEPALIAARVVQGIGAAMAQPLVIASATAVVTPDRRGWAIGVVASAGTTFLVVGPILGGLLLDAFGWRSIFAINVPVAAVAIVLALRFMPVSRAAGAPSLDHAGVGLLTVGLGVVVAGLLHIWSRSRRRCSA
jgi:DHA2 family methylenomycin A resistance protein-like MFS transporter